MGRVTDPTLRTRWDSPEGKALAAEAKQWLLRGGRRPRWLHAHNGRADLRGVPLGHLPTEPVRGLRWTSLDLTGASLPHLRATGAEFRDCVFDGAECPDWRLWSTRVEHSSFNRTDLNNSTLGTWHAGRGNHWEGDSLDGADLTATLWNGGLIRRCTFREARLDSARFLHATLDRVTFTGQLREVLFDGREIHGEPTAEPLRDVDYSQADFTKVEFRGYQLDHVRLPDGVRAVPHWPVVARRALDLLAADHSREARILTAEFRNWTRLIGQRDATGVFNRADYVDDGGEKLAQLAESVLWRATAPDQR